ANWLLFAGRRLFSSGAASTGRLPARSPPPRRWLLGQRWRLAIALHLGERGGGLLMAAKQLADRVDDLLAVRNRLQDLHEKILRSAAECADGHVTGVPDAFSAMLLDVYDQLFAGFAETGLGNEARDRIIAIRKQVAARQRMQGAPKQAGDPA